MIDINYDKELKEFYLFFQNQRYQITVDEIQNLKKRINSISTKSISKTTWTLKPAQDVVLSGLTINSIGQQAKKVKM
jgi:hypothetical protein